MTKIKWTAEIDDYFETLLGQEENLTFSQIARSMTERFNLPFTKNGCVGRAHRLRMPPRGPRLVIRKPRSKVIPMPIRIDAPILPKEAHVAADSRNLTLLQLRDGLCKWPGKGDKPPYLYCGHPTTDNVSFCPEHYVIAYQKPRKEFS